MVKLSTLALCLFTAGALPALTAASARADGCYTCGDRSSAECNGYCRYSGADTFGARKLCEDKGCRVVRSAPCPTGAPKICLAPAPSPSSPGGSGPTVAAITWCAAPPRS